MSNRTCRLAVRLALFAAPPLSSACAPDAALPGYQNGEDLPSSAIGDMAVGELLFAEKSCSNCHAYDGAGGEDAPPLDFMKDKLTATAIANMSGTIWNHLPQMLAHFEAEAIPVPTFAGSEMPDLIAYLHGESQPHDGSGTDYEAGDDLPSATFGDREKGAQLFGNKNCSDCHAYEGAGGEDASALDFMKGKISASQLAEMSGQTWNHVPHMLTYFEAEAIPVPTFVDDEMADLIAYLHGE